MPALLRSLHARLLLLSAAATLTALVLAGWAIGGVLGRFVTDGLDRRLDAEVALLASVVDGDGRVDRDRLRQRLGALAGGPGWRWRIVTPDGTIASADFPPLVAPPPPEPDGPPRHGPPSDDRLRALDGRAGERGVPIHARQLTIATRRGEVVLTAAAPREVVRRPLRGALLPLLAVLASLAVLLSAASVVQLRLGLRPLRRLRDQVAEIRAGARAAVDEDQPTELRPLAIELNALAAANTAALATARASAANLAHALKTPVAALALDLRDEPARAAQVARLDATIRHHLARARAEATNRRVATPLAPAVAGVVAAVRGLHAARDLAIDIDVDAALTVAVDPHDLDELLGNLLDNAARHATRRITVHAAPEPGDARQIRVEIADDGAGIPPADRAHVAQAGTRLDERGDGHGFGLAITADVAALYGGALRLDDAPGVGLLARVLLPAAARG